MVKITYAPWKEVIIHEKIEHSLDNLINMQAIGVPTGGMSRPLLWAEGILFRRFPMPQTPEIIKENLEGRVHFNLIEGAPMPEFKNFLEIRETKVRIPIINVSANAILSEVAKWLKQSTKSL